MTAREQRLAVGFGAILLLGGAFVGVMKLKSWKMRVDERTFAVTNRRIEADGLLALQDFWQERSAWLTGNQPLFTIRGDADSALLALIQKTAGEHQVKLVQTQLTEGIESGDMTTASMTVEGVGDMEKVLGWIYALQQPGSFISIPSLVLMPNPEDTAKVSLTMSIQKWYRLPAS